MSTLSIKLKQRARVLAAGAAITGITLAMLPGVAEAQSDSLGAVDVGSTVGGSVGSTAPADGGAGGSSGPISTDNVATSVNEVGAEGANNDTGLTSSSDSDLVPASVEATGDAAVKSPAGTQNVGVCGDFNSSVCFQDTADGSGDSTTPNSGDGVIADVDSVHDVSQQLTDNGLVGSQSSNTGVDSSAIPASGVVTGNGNVAVPGVINEAFDLCATVNLDGCTEATAPGSNTGGGTSPGNGIDVDSSTIINEALANGGFNGDAFNETVVNAPVPANGSVLVDGNAVIGEIVNQNAGICVLLNRAGCEGATTPPAGGGGTPPGSGSPITSVTDIIGNQNIGPGGSTGTTLIDSVTTAPVPASVLVNANGNAAVDGVLNQGIDACVALNANCGQATPPGTDPSGTDSGGTTPIGTTPIGTTPVDATPVDATPIGTTPGDSASSDSASSTTLGSTAPDEGASGSELALAQQPSAGGSSSADGRSQASASGGSQASASGGSQASASSGSQEEASTSLSGRIPATGGVSPLLMITTLLLIGAGIFCLVAMMRRSGRLNS